MYKLYLILGVLICVSGKAQISVSESNRIRLATIFPENIDQLDQGQLSRLNSKITDMVTVSGFSGSEGYYSSFVIYPKILVNSVEAVETGISKIYKADMDITLVIKQIENNIIFSSTTITNNGFGSSKREAIHNAIREIKTQRKDLQEFFTVARNKIVSFYNANCFDIIKKANVFSGQKEYQKSLVTLFSIPSEVKCSNEAYNQILKVYKLYQQTECSKSIQMAKAKIAERDFSSALNILSSLDPESNCKSESDKLINVCSKNISETEKRNFQFLTQALQNENELEKRRINAARDIAIAYFNSQPTTITYNSLILW